MLRSSTWVIHSYQLLEIPDPPEAHFRIIVVLLVFKLGRSALFKVLEDFDETVLIGLVNLVIRVLDELQPRHLDLQRFDRLGQHARLPTNLGRLYMQILGDLFQDFVGIPTVCPGLLH